MSSSIFAIDTTNHVNFVDEANFIRIGILMDGLEQDDEVINRAKGVLLSIYDGHIGKIKAYSFSFLEFLDTKYGKETKTREALLRLSQL